MMSINITVFLYTKNQQLEIAIKNNNIGNIINMKYVQINIIQSVQELYVENCKILLRKVIQCLYIWRLNNVVVPDFTKLILRFKVISISIKIPAGFLKRLTISFYLWKCKGQNSQDYFESEDHWSMLPVSKTNC